ncbi:MAG: hypothetical protein KDJ38_04445 [Gammaproteobacteria bacterium]|nr:hypothetical protein [Gammaproteobacteria bacterium]
MKKLFVVLTDSTMHCYMKSASGVSRLADFAVDDKTSQRLQAVLAENRFHVCSLVFDLSDEEFYLEGLPADGFWQRKTMMNARLSRHFSTSDFTCAIGEQPGVSGEKKRKRLLCAGLRQTAYLQGVFSLLRSVGLVVERVYMLSGLLGEFVKQHDKTTVDFSLVISSQTGKQWRYSLFQAGFLLLSRSVFSRHQDVWADIYSEVRETIKYARQAGLLTESSKPSVHFLGPELPASAFELVLRKKFDCKGLSGTGSGRSLYECMVCYIRPLRHQRYRYSRSGLKTAYSKLLLAHGLLVLSAMATVASSVYAIDTVDLAISKKLFAERLDSQAKRIKKRLDNFSGETNSHKYVVADAQLFSTIFTKLDREAGLRTQLGALATALTGYQAVRLERVYWSRNNDAGDSRLIGSFYPRITANVKDEVNLVANFSAVAPSFFENDFLRQLENAGFLVKKRQNEGKHELIQAGRLNKELIENDGGIQTLSLLLKHQPEQTE